MCYAPHRGNRLARALAHNPVLSVFGLLFQPCGGEWNEDWIDLITTCHPPSTIDNQKSIGTTRPSAEVLNSRGFCIPCFCFCTSILLQRTRHLFASALLVRVAVPGPLNAAPARSCYARFRHSCPKSIPINSAHFDTPNCCTRANGCSVSACGSCS